jgi:hypothetical protein
VDVALHLISAMEPIQCDGALTPAETQALDEGIELALYTCTVCGKRNLYPVKDLGGKWVPEAHRVPMPRLQKDRTGNPKG